MFSLPSEQQAQAGALLDGDNNHRFFDLDESSSAGPSNEHGHFRPPESTSHRPAYEPGRVRPEDVIYTVKGETRQSRRIPYWLWVAIAKSLGIRLNSNEKPILAWALHLFTVLSAAALGFTQIWYSGYDIASVHTQSDVLDGTVSVIMMILYINLGVYAHRLAFRDGIHKHSSLILFAFVLVSTSVVTSKPWLPLEGYLVVLRASWFFHSLLNWVQNISAVRFFYGKVDNVTSNSTVVINPCQTVEVPLLLCQSLYLSQVIFSLFFLLWNGLVATVLVSVARTHTIAIRRFICQLEIDAHIMDQKLRHSFFADGTADANDTLKHYLWTDSDRLKDILDSSDEQTSSPVLQQQSSQPVNPSVDDPVNPADDDPVNAEREIEEEHPAVFNSGGVKLKLKEESTTANDAAGSRLRRRRRNPFQIPSRRTVFGRFRRLTEDVDVGESEDDLVEPYVLSEEEILYKHWKLAMATRFTSTALQRWTSVATITIILWSAVRIVSWLSHKPNICDVFSFVLPLLILPLIASAYAEVNFEGMKVLQSILPTIKRTSIFRYLYGMPIQMTVYGHPVTYGTMGTVLAAVVAAFLSKVVLQEMNKLIDEQS